jgi:hypothetical protein
MSRKEFHFKSKLSPIKATFLNTVIYLPENIVKILPKGRIRTKGTINGAAFALAPQYKKDGSRFFSVSAALRKAAKIKEGDAVDVKFWLVDADIVDIPEELEVVLEQDEEGKRVWDTFTKGMQRSLIIYVTSVKNIDSRIKRSLELVAKAKSGSLSIQKQKAKK